MVIHGILPFLIELADLKATDLLVLLGPSGKISVQSE